MEESPLFSPSTIRSDCRRLYGGVAAIERQNHAAAWRARCVRYNSAKPEGLEAVNPVEALSPEVVEDLRHGRATRERKLAVCTGGAHLAPADRAEILAILASDTDEMIATRASDAILSMPPESFVEAIKQENAQPALFVYASRNLADKPGICDALVQNKNCAAESLVHIARPLSGAATQALM